jgi:hypothetical protein
MVPERLPVAAERLTTDLNGRRIAASAFHPPTLPPSEALSFSSSEDAMMSVRVCFLLFVSALTMAQSNPVPFTKQPLATGLPNGVSQPDTAARGRTVESYGTLPLSFEANRGQTDARVKFLSRGASSTASPSGLNFAAAVDYGSGGYQSQSVAVADVNGDGKPDLLVVNSCADSTCGANGTVAVLLGNGDGTFQKAVICGSGGFLASSIAVADVNGDGRPDLLVTNYAASRSDYYGGNMVGTVGVLLGNGDGTFQTAVAYGSGGYEANSIAVADVNGDGKLDVLVANLCAIADCGSNGTDGNVGVLLGNGDGSFQTPVSYDSGGGYDRSVAVADVNGDGKPDLLVANELTGTEAGGTAGVLLGNGDGTFQSVVTYGPGGYAAWSLAVADVNGDGKPDLLVANVEASPGSENGSVGVLLGNGDGTFKTAVAYGSGQPRANSVAVADVNGDGKPDLVVANLCVTDPTYCTSTAVAVLLGNGDGTFQTAVTYLSGGYEAESAAIADVNGDGKPDLVVVNVCPSSSNCNNGIVGVLINTSLGPTTTALASSLNPSNSGQSVTFTATVTSGGFKDIPAGTVTFWDGTANIGNSNLSSSGVATLTISTLLAGTHSITASYEGSTDFASSTSPVLSQTVRGAIAKLSASSITFGNETVGMTSVAKSVTLTNKGNINLTIASVAIAGADGADFAASKCPASIAPNGTCVISVTFKPTVAGTRTATLSITDSAPSHIQTVSLTGVGVLPAITLSPTALTFPTQVVFTTSAAKVVTLKNTGLGIANIEIGVTGPFSQKHSCGAVVNPGGGCTISVTFEPKAMGGLTGSLTVTDNASNSPQKVTLTGTGTYIQLTPTSINFGNQPEGSTSLTKQITLTNAGAGAVTITGIAITGTDAGDFAQTHTCGTSVASGGRCFINVTFTPSITGARTAQVSISDNGGGSPQKVNLTGTGTP